MAGSAYKLWQEKHSPLWLLQASRSCAQYPNRENIAPEDVDLYLRQFAFPISADLRNDDLLGHMHPGHKELFTFIAQNTSDYNQVFKGAYGVELLHQAAEVFGNHAVESLNPDNLQPRTIHNLIVGLSIAVIRDMSIIEHAHSTGEIKPAEYNFALNDINKRMNRLGVNGVDRLFESRPELENFVAHDTTIIDVQHIVTERSTTRKTRAACYNARNDFKGFSFEENSLTRLRQNVISPAFASRADDFSKNLLIHIHDVEAPNPQIREKYKGCGIVLGGSENDTSEKQLHILHTIAEDMKHERFESFNEYMNFLIYDGIAINSPDRNKFLDNLPMKMSSIVNEDGIHLDHVSNPNKKQNDQLPKPTLLLPEPTGLQPLPTEPNQISSKISSDPKAPESRKSENIAPKTKAEPKSSDGIIEKQKDLDDEDNSDKKSGDKKKAAFAAKATAIGGTAAAIGLLLSEKRSTSSDNSPIDSDTTSNAPPKEDHSLAKKFAFAAASTVAIGGVIAWSRKPKFLYEPLQKLMKTITKSI